MTNTLKIPPEEIHIWQVALDQHKELVDRLAQNLNREELDRANRFVIEKARQRYIVAKSTLRQLLSHYIGFPPEKIDIRLSEKGKPYLINFPLEFNLSHSEDLAIYAFSAYQALGVDIEKKGKKIEVLKLAKRFFSQTEYKELKNLPPDEQQIAFFHIWTRKEAFVKALGQGLTFPLHDFSVSASPREPKLLFSKRHDVAAWSLVELKVPAEFVGALVVAGKINKIIYHPAYVPHF